MGLPNFLIIGESKCGTTSMYDMLIQHPQILPSLGNGEDLIVDADVPLGVKEIRFFDKYYNRGWDWYKSCFPKCPEGCITGEATPTYFGREQAMNRILSVMPDIKMILMIRDPAERLISHYNHICFINKRFHKKYPTFEDYWLTAEEKDYYLIERSNYLPSYERIFKHRVNIQVVYSHLFFTQYKYMMSYIFDFLGVDNKFQPKIKHSRKQKLPKRKISDSILKEVKEFYQQNYEQFKGLTYLD